MMGRPPWTGPTLRGLAVLCLCLALGDTASADDPWEFWPEGQFDVGLNPRTRLFLSAAYAQSKESPNLALDAAAYLDISFLPIGRRRRRAYMDEDWQRGRYFWARVGYASSRPRTGKGPPERTGAASLSGARSLAG